MTVFEDFLLTWTAQYLIKGLYIMYETNTIDLVADNLVRCALPDHNLTIENIGISPIDQHLTYGIQL